MYLLICGLGSFAGTTAFTLNLVYQATVVGLGPLQLVLVGTVMEGVCFVAQVPTGVLADVVSAMAAALGSVVVTGLVGRRLDATRPRRVGQVLAAVDALTAAGMIAFGLSSGWWPAVPLYLLVQLLRNSAMPITNAWLASATTADSRATVFSIQAQADALGQIAGGPPVGVLAQRRSLGAGLSVAGLFLVPAVVLFALAARRSGPVRADVVVEPLA